MHILPRSALLVLALAWMFPSCDENPPLVSGPNGFGDIDPSVYVAIGNSLTAGVQSNALYESGQRYSFPNLIAGQMGTPFLQPLIPDPGTGGRITLASLDPPTLSIGPTRIADTKFADTARPFNNLGIPGANVADALDSMDAATKFLLTGNPFFPIVLHRQATLGRSVVAQAISQAPTVLTLWLGNNDVLYYAVSGGTNPPQPTSLDAFDRAYNQTMRTLRAALPGTRIVVANIADIRSIPYFRAVTDIVADTMIRRGGEFVFQRHGERGAGSGRFTFVPGLLSRPYITLEAYDYAALIGKPTGRWYSDRSISPPPGIDTTRPFGLDPRNPFPDALVLDTEEQQVAIKAVQEYNDRIRSYSNQYGAALVDIFTRFDEIDKTGYDFAGEHLTTDFISGGIFSLDGIHVSSKGAALIANEFLAVMNRTWNANIPLVDVTRIPGIPAPLRKSALPSLHGFHPGGFAPGLTPGKR